MNTSDLPPAVHTDDPIEQSDVIATEGDIFLNEVVQDLKKSSPFGRIELALTMLLVGGVLGTLVFGVYAQNVVYIAMGAFAAALVGLYRFANTNVDLLKPADARVLEARRMLQRKNISSEAQLRYLQEDLELSLAPSVVDHKGVGLVQTSSFVLGSGSTLLSMLLLFGVTASPTLLVGGIFITSLLFMLVFIVYGDYFHPRKQATLALAIAKVAVAKELLLLKNATTHEHKGQ